MHSALGARNVLFLAPLHSLQLRCVQRRRLRQVASTGLSYSLLGYFYVFQLFHNILRYLRPSAYICGFKVIFITGGGGINLSPRNADLAYLF